MGFEWFRIFRNLHIASFSEYTRVTKIRTSSYLNWYCDTCLSKHFITQSHSFVQMTSQLEDRSLLLTVHISSCLPRKTLIPSLHSHTDLGPPKHKDKDSQKKKHPNMHSTQIPTLTLTHKLTNTYSYYKRAGTFRQRIVLSALLLYCQPTQQGCSI